MILSPVLASFATFLYRKIKYGWSGDKSLLPVCREEAFVEFTLSSQVDDVAIVTEKISAFCEEQNVSQIKGNVIALAAEEMVVHAIQNNEQLKRKISIDVTMAITEESLLLSIRDDGIQLLRKMVTDVTYLRLMNCNCTSITVNKG